MTPALAIVLLAACAVMPSRTTAQQAPPVNPPATATQKPAEDHSQHTTHAKEQGPQPKTPIPPVTDADREAAFPANLEGHAVHDRGFQYFVLFDNLEWRGGTGGGINVENTSWFGGDINRAWVRVEGESHEGELEQAEVHALWGRSVSRWWDVVAGVRQDFQPGAAQTWAAFGIQGLAPYWFEIEATGYVGSGWRTHARLEVEYEMLLTNRLVLQPQIQIDIHGTADRARGIGAGISSLEAGLRVRYEIRREFAPYVGIAWDRKVFGTADVARAQGASPASLGVVLGLRTWF